MLHRFSNISRCGFVACSIMSFRLHVMTLDVSVSAGWCLYMLFSLFCYVFILCLFSTSAEEFLSSLSHLQLIDVSTRITDCKRSHILTRTYRSTGGGSSSAHSVPMQPAQRSVAGAADEEGLSLSSSSRSSLEQLAFEDLTGELTGGLTSEIAATTSASRSRDLHLSADPLSPSSASASAAASAAAVAVPAAGTSSGRDVSLSGASSASAAGGGGASATTMTAAAVSAEGFDEADAHGRTYRMTVVTGSKVAVVTGSKVTAAACRLQQRLRSPLSLNSINKQVLHCA